MNGYSDLAEMCNGEHNVYTSLLPQQCILKGCNTIMVTTAVNMQTAAAAVYILLVECRTLEGGPKRSAWGRAATQQYNITKEGAGLQHY